MEHEYDAINSLGDTLRGKCIILGKYGPSEQVIGNLKVLFPPLFNVLFWHNHMDSSVNILTRLQAG
jgi:hypothetical protein